MIKSNKSKIADRIFGLYLRSLLRKHFYRIHLSCEENIGYLDKRLPTIFYANHSNWWDGFIAYFLSSKRWKRDDYLMMDIEQMKKYRFFKYLGVFSVDRTNPRLAMETIDYAGTLLQNTNRVLWMFPQGILQPQDFRPIEFFSGITNLAERIDRVNLQPVAIRYEFMLEQRPEIFIKLGRPDTIDESKNIHKDFTTYLRDKLVNELEIVKQSVLNNNTAGFEIIFRGKESKNKTIDRIKAD